jgi:hypothetical protein
MSPEQIQSFLALAFGFAMAGSVATGYQALTRRPASFRLLRRGALAAAFAAVPMLAFAAPYIIMRNTIRGRQLERRRMHSVMMATVLAGVWSLISGTAILSVLQSLGLLTV